VQFTMPELTDPYTSLSAKKRLLRQYKHMNDRMHRKSRPLKLLFHSSEHETMLGWVKNDTFANIEYITVAENISNCSSDAFLLFDSPSQKKPKNKIGHLRF